jgi:hypothetical protein
MMKKLGKVLLAVALLAGSVFVARAQTVSSAGGPINASYNIPFPTGTPSCTIVSPSTFTPTQLVAAATSPRLGLYIVNQSSMSLAKASSSANADTRPADIWVMFQNTSIGNTAAGCGAAGTVGVGPSIPCLPNLPGIRLRGLMGTSTTESASDSGNRLKWDGFGTPQGAIYAIAESTGAGVNVGAKLAVCDFQSQ